MKKIAENLYTITGWDIIKKGYNSEQSITDGTTFLLGNGYLGYRGTFAEDRKEDYVACIVTDTWDNADGKWEELSNVPNALYAAFYVDNSLVDLKKDSQFKRVFSLKDGLTTREVEKTVQGVTWRVKEDKFVSYSEKNVIAMRIQFSVDQDLDIEYKTGIDYDLWNINGEHLTDYQTSYDHGDPYIECKTQEKGTEIVVNSLIQCSFDGDNYHDSRLFGKRYALSLKAHQTYQFDHFMVVHTSNDYANPKHASFAQKSALKSYEDVYQAHREAWDYLWTLHDIKLQGNLIDQVALRYNLYQAIIATPVHKPLPIGARGLSCQAYQGAAFWDQEIYNLPMYLYTHQQVAKNILIYRYNTLDGARKKAKKHGYEGAFYAWISGKTGDELCPDFFFKDVLSGRPIRNHFNLWQIHISFDISYTIHRYYLATEDFDFMTQYGLEMLIEIARFAASRVVYLPRLDRYDIRQVQGPDEYHENVDNNAYTNYLAKFSLEYALNYLTMLENYELESLRKKLDLRDQELLLWKEIHEKLYLPEISKDGLLEQFDGYFKLESIVPASDVTKRLIDPEEYYGWPNGITVFTQCLKQADVIQLFSLYPNLFEKSIVEKNYDYYEPRTLHFSSLSPATHAIVAAQVNKTSEAYRHFKRSVMIDLLNTNESVSGGTFIGGTHTAANGASWQIVMHGFIGFSIDEDGLNFNPQLPSDWQSLETRLEYKGHPMKIIVDKTTLEIIMIKPFKTSISVRVNNTKYSLKERLTLKY